MTTTPAEKNALLAEAWKLVGTALRSVSLPEDDYSDLRATCIEAADRAIDSWEAGKGRSISSWIFRFIVQAKRDYFRSRGTKRRSIDECSVCFSELQHDDDRDSDERTPNDAEEESARHHASLVQDMEIIIDRARNDDIIDEREYRVLVARREGLTFRRIAVDEGLTAARIYGIQEAAVAKIRLTYRTAE